MTLADSPNSTKRSRSEMKEILAEARGLLKRGRSKIDAAHVSTIGLSIDGLQQRVKARDVSDDAQAAAAELVALLDRHLAFARKSKPREYFESIGLAVLLALMLRAFAFEAFQIPTASMEPTLLVGDHLFVAKNAFGIRVPFTTKYLIRWRDVERGDIVVFRFPAEEVRTQTYVGVLTRHILQYQRTGGRFPASLDAATDPVTGQPPPTETRIDAWGSPFRYESNGDIFSLQSAGADGVFDTADDIDHQNSAFYNGLDRCLDEDSVEYGKDYIKRIIGLPGDRVRLRDGVVYVNDVAIARSQSSGGGVEGGLSYTDLTESLDNGLAYTIRSFGVDPNFGEITVRAGHVFAMGDNRDRSSDGRCWGQVPINNIKGTAMFIFFSRDRSGRGGIRWERFFDGIH